MMHDVSIWRKKGSELSRNMSDNHSQDFVIRFAGEGGQGLVTSADAMARAAANAGYYVSTFSTFPSQIMGGPASSQVRISTSPVLSSGDSVDVLVSLDEYAYNNHREDLSDNGVAIYNSGEFQLPGGGQYFGIDADELAKSTGNTRAANMVTIGAVAHLIGFSLEEIDAFITARFTRGRPGDEEIIESNKKAIRLGADVAAKSGFSVGTLASSEPAGLRTDNDHRQCRAGARRGDGRGRLLRRLPDIASDDDTGLDGAKSRRAGQVRAPSLFRDRGDQRNCRRWLCWQKIDDRYRGSWIVIDG